MLVAPGLGIFFLFANLKDTNIALMAKVDHQYIMRDMRPISLCKVIYKIL